MRLVCLAVVFLPLLLAACGGPAQSVWATDEAVARARYAHDGPSTVTLFTVQSTDTGFGAHAGLMISGAERVIFDPAGTFRLNAAPERNDLLYGITDRVLSVYIDYHARSTYDVQIQSVTVSPREADALIAAAAAFGAVPKAQCALSISKILRSQPRFAHVKSTYFPNALSEDFAALSGVETRVVTDVDSDDNHGVLIEAGG